MVNQLKAIKCKFKKILHPNVNYSKLFDCISRTNKITQYCYHFIRYYILNKFEKDEEIPEVNVNFVKRVFKVLSKSSRGPKNKQSMNDIHLYLKKFMKYSKMNDLLDAKNLSYILNEEEVKISTVYSNNIKINFHKYLFQALNELSNIPRIKRKKKEEINTFTDIEKEEYKKQINELMKYRKEKIKNLSEIKKDILMNTLNSDIKHHKFIQNFRNEYLPELSKKTLMEDVVATPFKYLKSLLKMNRVLEDKELKMFQSLPLRNDLSPKYVSLNTGVLRDVFGVRENNKLKPQEVWNKYFNINPKIFKIKGCCFDNYIQTDGFSVSIIFMNNEDFKRKTITHEKMTTASKKGKQKLKIMTKEDIIKEKQKQQSEQKKKENEKEEFIKKKKDEFKKLNIEDKEKIKLSMRLKQEFPYFDDILKNDELKKHLEEQYEMKKIVGCDPGLKDLLTMLDLKGKRFNYRKKRRINETKRNKYQRLRQSKFNWLIEDNKELNNKLKKYSCKTTYINKFKSFIKTKFSLIDKLGKNKIDIYGNYINKLKWYSYINTRRHEDKLLNEIEETYGKDTTIIIGDWSQKDGIKGISAPAIGLKRLLKKRFEVYLLDEFGTSKKSYKTGEDMEHHKIIKTYVKDGKEIKYIKEMYSILKFKTSNGYGCINRDMNAVQNMIKIIKGEIEGSGRPEYLQRKHKELKTKSIKPIDRKAEL